MPIRTIRYQGREVQCEGVEFESEHEAFNSYLLHDGTKLKLKSIVLDVVRLDEFNQQGEPIYVIKSQNAVTAIVPDNLKKKTQ